MSANRFMQSDINGGSHNGSEFPGVSKQLKVERETARLIDMIATLDLLNLAPDEALAKIERRSGVRGVMEALRRWLRADRSAQND